MSLIRKNCVRNSESCTDTCGQCQRRRQQKKLCGEAWQIRVRGVRGESQCASRGSRK